MQLAAAEALTPGLLPPPSTPQEYNTTILQSISMPTSAAELHQVTSSQRVVFGPGFKVGFKSLASSGQIFGSMASAGGYPFDVLLDSSNVLSSPIWEVKGGRKGTSAQRTTMPSAAIMIPGPKTSYMVVTLDGQLPSALYLLQVGAMRAAVRCAQVSACDMHWCGQAACLQPAPAVPVARACLLSAHLLHTHCIAYLAVLHQLRHLLHQPAAIAPQAACLTVPPCQQAPAHNPCISPDP